MGLYAKVRTEGQDAPPRATRNRFECHAGHASTARSSAGRQAGSHAGDPALRSGSVSGRWPCVLRTGEGVPHGRPPDLHPEVWTGGRSESRRGHGSQSSISARCTPSRSARRRSYAPFRPVRCGCSRLRKAPGPCRAIDWGQGHCARRCPTRFHPTDWHAIQPASVPKPWPPSWAKQLPPSSSSAPQTAAWSSRRSCSGDSRIGTPSRATGSSASLGLVPSSAFRCGCCSRAEVLAWCLFSWAVSLPSVRARGVQTGVGEPVLAGQGPDDGRLASR